MKDYDPLDLRGQERSKSESEARLKLHRENEEADLKWLMGTKRGRRIVWRTLDRAGVFRLSFNTNAMAMAFAEGNRNEGLRTIGLIHSVCPDLYVLMIKESTDDARNNDDAGRNDH